jgi:plasmid maintenance system antidote protein VapI
MDRPLECNFRELLETPDWSVSKLALLAGVNKGRVSEIANGKRVRNKKEHARLSETLGFEVEQWRETDVSVRVKIPPCN